MNYPVIILFDGVCNLCNGSVRFIIRRDRKKQFRFAPLQGKTGQAILQRYGLPENDLHSFVLVENERVFTRSTAALRVLKGLGGGWRLLYGLILVPRVIRDAVYGWIARNRYRWFGKRESCMVPSPGWEERFLD